MARDILDHNETESYSSASLPGHAVRAGGAVSADRIARIRACLEAAFSPDVLEIVDDGHLHVGHAGARDGKGHFSVRIISRRFKGTSPLERHRMVFDALSTMLETDIHALRLIASPPRTPKDSSQKATI